MKLFIEIFYQDLPSVYIYIYIYIYIYKQNYELFTKFYLEKWLLWRVLKVKLAIKYIKFKKFI
ncbi:hypothetical protein ACMBCM_00150 [Spiroplasma sp. K1]